MRAKDGQTPLDEQLNESELGAEASVEVAVSDQDSMPSELAETGSQRSFWVAAVFLGLLVIGVNFPYQYAVVKTSTYGKVSSVVDFDLAALKPPVIGGWPFRYLISYPVSGVKTFSFLALAYDFLIAGFVVALLLWYVRRRSLRSQLGASNLTISDLLLATVLLAAPFGYWQHLGRTSKAEVEFGKELKRAGGSYVASALVPKLLVRHVPTSLIDRIRCIRGIRIEHADDATIDNIVKCRQLNTLRLGGSKYDLAKLQQLPTAPGLADLRIAGRQLDKVTVEWINAQSRIHTLNLMRTNTTAKVLGGFEGLVNLRRLSLIHSDVKAAEISSPPWSETIEELRLPHPLPGDSDEFAISGWAKLKKLEINELDTQTNPTVMLVHLADLPSLETLAFDQFQKFDLQLEDLPSLKEIKPQQYEWTARIPRGGMAPGTLWVGSFKADGVPNLEVIEVFLPDLREFQVLSAPKFKTLNVGAFYRTLSGNTYATEIHKDAAAALMNGVASSDGPEMIDLDAVPLGGVDFTPLANNERLTHIKLSNSRTTIKNWRQLSKMTWLKALEIKQNGGGIEAGNWALATFPNLESLAYSSGMADQTRYIGPVYSDDSVLEIVDKPNFQSLDTGELGARFYTKVRIVNSPNIALELKLDFVQELELVNCPKVSGLSVQSPLPPKTKLSGVSGFEFFTVGGANVTDELVLALQPCKRLLKLTLAYSSVTEKGLAVINNFPQLQSLALPGAPLTDEIVLRWPKLRLGNLDLSDTKVTGNSLEHLVNASVTSRLILDRCKAKPDELGFLEGLINLRELSLAEVGIDAKTLDAVLSNDRLQELNLSGSEVSAELLNVLVQNGGSLKFLDLTGCKKIDERNLMSLVRSNPSLRLDFDDENIAVDSMTALLSSQRIVSREEWEMHKLMEKNMMMMNSMRATGQVYAMEPEMPSGIDVRVFNPDWSFGDAGMGFQQVVPAPQKTSTFGGWLGSLLGGANPPPAEDEPPVSTDVDVEIEEIEE